MLKIERIAKIRIVKSMIHPLTSTINSVMQRYIYLLIITCTFGYAIGTLLIAIGYNLAIIENVLNIKVFSIISFYIFLTSKYLAFNRISIKVRAAI
jgi:hypothetical protein